MTPKQEQAFRDQAYELLARLEKVAGEVGFSPRALASSWNLKAQEVTMILSITQDTPLLESSLPFKVILNRGRGHKVMDFSVTFPMEWATLSEPAMKARMDRIYENLKGYLL